MGGRFTLVQEPHLRQLALAGSIAATLHYTVYLGGRVFHVGCLTLTIALWGHLTLVAVVDANTRTVGPAVLVQQYCQLDFGSACLSSATWKHFAPLIAKTSPVGTP
jgi:hypothetical protein